MKIIDPHVHLFDLAIGSYHWLKPDKPPNWVDKHKINRNFSDEDLALSTPLTLEGAIHIEAGFNNQQPWQELDWLATTSDKVLGAVACVDLTLAPQDFAAQLHQLSTCNNLVGVRHILDEDALEILNHLNCFSNFEQLTAADILFECQVFLADIEVLTHIATLLNDLPKLRMVINHCGFPNAQNLSEWQFNLQEIAKFENVSIKCSGFEMIDRNYNQVWQQKILKQIFDSFGTKRVMLASNFPLCLFTLSYQEYWQRLITISQNIKPNEIAKLCNANAKRIYGLI